MALNETSLDETEVDLLGNMVDELFKMFEKFEHYHEMAFSHEKKTEIITSTFIQCSFNEFGNVDPQWAEDVQNMAGLLIMQKEDDLKYETAWV